MDDFKVVCAWCGHHISGSDGAANTSHGICQGCSERQREEFEATRTEWTDIGGEG